MFHQAGVSDSLHFVLSWFVSSMVKRGAFSLLRHVIPSTVCCEVHRSAKTSLKIRYALSASVLDLQKMTKVWNSCWCNPLHKDPTLYLKGCFAALHLKTCVAHGAAFSFYWHQHLSSPLIYRAGEQPDLRGGGKEHAGRLRGAPCLTFG